jgi:hypothetical protein
MDTLFPLFNVWTGKGIITAFLTFQAKLSFSLYRLLFEKKGTLLSFVCFSMFECCEK